jgi:formate/nitrite transporter FocA (FNT family)
MALQDIDEPHKEVLHRIEHKGADLLTGSPFQQALLAITAGSFITFSACLAAVLSSEVASFGMRKFVQGIAFTMGFSMWFCLARRFLRKSMLFSRASCWCTARPLLDELSFFG